MDTDKTSMDRRDLLKAGAVPAVALLAGCPGGGDGDGNGGSGGDNGGGEPVPTIQVLAMQWQTIADEFRFIARQLEDNLGLSTNYETIDVGTYLSQVYAEGDFDHIAQNGHLPGPGRIDPAFFYTEFVSPEEVPGGAQNSNITGYSNEEYDELYFELVGSYDTETRKEASRQMQEILMEDLPAIYYAQPHQTWVYNSDNWDIPGTQSLGIGGVAAMSFHEAEPLGDQQKLRVGGEEPIVRGNPLTTDSSTLQFFYRNIWDTPRRFSLDGEFFNWAVEEFEVVDDTTIDMTLRDGMTFHDGEPVTAGDLAFSYEFFSEAAWPLISGYAGNVSSVSEETDSTVRVGLDRPDATFVTHSAVWIPILPSHIWEDVRAAETPSNYSFDQEELVGSGPLEIADMDDSFLDLDRFEDHFDPFNSDGVVYALLESQEGRRAALANDEIDNTHNALPPVQAEELANSHDHLSQYVAEDAQWMEGMSMKVDKPPFDDKVLRQAAVRAIDWETMGQSVWGGRVTFGWGTILPVANAQDGWGSTDGPTMPELYNPDEARQLLEDAGYTWDDSGQLQYPSE